MRPTASLATTLVAAALALPVAAQEAPAAPPPGWSGQAELSLVAVSGNAEAQTLGFKGMLKDQLDGAALVFEAGALDAESTTTRRSAERLADGSVVLREESETERTAEAYFARGRYERQLAGGWGWLAGAGWERNELAGIANRYIGLGGVSRLWFESATAHLRTDAGATWTQEDPVADAPGGDDAFVGLRFSWDYLRQLTPTTTFTSLLALLPNLEESDDLRLDTTQALAVSINAHLALRASWQLLWDGQPAFVAVPVLAAGAPTGEVAFAELDELDSLLTAALVVTF
jgi:hypothetical protein